MSFQIECPNCGCRPAWEFHYSGPVRARPATVTSDRQWAEYLYNRANTCGVETELWTHRSACKLWFVVRRDTRTNQVLESMRYEPQEASGE